jgi:hypothetical protein
VSVLTLDEAKVHLNITADTYDAELVTIMDAAESVITARCGPLAPVAMTCRIGGGRALVLPSPPVVSLTSVAPVGWDTYADIYSDAYTDAMPLAELYLDGAAGLVTQNMGGVFSSAFYDVVYESGRVSVPDDLLLAVKELTRHLWSTSQRGGSRRPGSEAMAANPATYLLPYAVQSLLEPHMIGPGIH